MDPEARQRQLFAVVRRAVQARSRRETAVTVIEDLHWLDGASEAFVETLVEAVAGTRTLLLLNFRPEYHAGWMQRSYYQQLPLLPLGDEAVEELLRELLGTGSALAGVIALIRERTGGNPFFVEEVVQSLAESGVLAGERGAYWLAQPVEAIALPTTVQAILAARIDRLGEREKTVLQTGAVVGTEFPETTSTTGHTPFVHVERAHLAASRGDATARGRHLREAQRLFVERGAPLRAAHVAAGL
jgi:adenylate cyclase